MFDTTVCLVGNVMTEPEWRRTTVTGAFVATFRFASTSRRFDKTTNRWVDGDSLRIKVACWRNVGQNVMQSVTTGDPLVVFGRLYSRDWIDNEQHRRTSYELDAVAIGHDLSRGTSKFSRKKAVAPTDMIDDAENDAAIGGEMSEAMKAVRPADMDEGEPFHQAMYVVASDLPDGDEPPVDDGDLDGPKDSEEIEELDELAAVG